MAKKRGPEESPFTYFNRIFHEHPEWLKLTSNKEVRRRYNLDHGKPPDAKLDQKVVEALGNTKTRLRKQMGIMVPRGRKATRGVKAAAAEAAPAAPASPAPVAARGRPPAISTKLEQLEDQIDECVFSARQVDPQRLARVIALLKQARNTVVLMRQQRG